MLGFKFDELIEKAGETTKNFANLMRLYKLISYPKNNFD